MDLSDLMYTRIEYVRYDFSKVIGFEHLDIVFVKCDLHCQIRSRTSVRWMFKLEIY